MSLSKIDGEKLFADVLDKKEAIKQTSVYEKRKIRNFPKGLVHRFVQKFLDFLKFGFYAK